MIIWGASVIKGGLRKPVQTRVAKGGRVVKWKGKTASIAPSVFLAIATLGTVSTGIAEAEVVSVQESAPRVFSDDEDNQITSSGAVTVSAATAPAVTVATAYSSSLTNDGTVSATASSLAVGLQLNDHLLTLGQVVNNGAIDASVNGGTGNIRALGFQANGDVSGVFTNIGALSANASAIADNAVAIGGNFENGIESTGSVLNTGMVSAVAAAGSSNASATALMFGDDVSTTIRNTGTLSASTTSGASVSVAGLNIDGALNGNIISSNTITAATNTGAETAGAVAVRVADGMTGNTTSSSTVTDNASGNSSILAGSTSVVA